ncbi:MAG: FHA domain-containing protein [Acidimicrobiales bacterium]
MSEQLLGILKLFLIALMWLFFLRVVRAAWVEVRRARPAGAEPPLVPVPPPARPELPERHDLLRLEVVDPPERRGLDFQLGEETTVGRAPGCGVSLPADSFTSHLHARIFLRDGVAYVEDLGSTNGTWLNAQRVETATPLRPGDRLQVGRTVLELSR